MLRRKLWRDLWQNRTQFLSIFLMAFLGMMVFAGIDAESNGLGVSDTRLTRPTPQITGSSATILPRGMRTH